MGAAITRQDVRWSPAGGRLHRRLGPGTWRPPIHLTWIMVNAEGKVCAQVRTLGFQFPKKDRRYAARLDGVEWFTTAGNIITTPKWLTIRGFSSPKAAMQAIDEARALILAEEDA